MLFSDIIYSPDKIHMIVNPASRGSDGRMQLNAIQCELSSLFAFPFSTNQMHLTRKRGDALAIARILVEDRAELIISIGGDGTHNEVINGFFEPDGSRINKGAKIAFLDKGTGGDLCRSLRIGPGLHGSLLHFAQGTLKSMDIGQITFMSENGDKVVSYFVNAFSAGISGLVDRYSSRSRLKFLGGKTVFYLATLRSFFGYSNRSIRCIMDRTTDKIDRSVCIAVANGRYFGGGMKIAPNAMIDDGYLDTVCLGDFSMYEFLTKSSMLYKGTHLSLGKVWHGTAKHIEITSTRETLIDLDGEAPGYLPVIISVMPSALQVIAGNGSEVFVKSDQVAVEAVHA